MTSHARRQRACALAFLAAATLLLAAAALAYPGGSWANHHADGFAFWVNYWCDLLSDEAWNGEPNGTSQALAKSAFAALGVGTFFLWRVAARSIRGSGARRLLMISGNTASFLALVIAGLPYETGHITHVVSTLSAGAAGFVASMVVLFGELQNRPATGFTNLVGVAFGASALTNIAVYGFLVVTATQQSATLPIVQKIGTLALVFWVFAVLLSPRPTDA